MRPKSADPIDQHSGAERTRSRGFVLVARSFGCRWIAVALRSGQLAPRLAVAAASAALGLGALAPGAGAEVVRSEGTWKINGKVKPLEEAINPIGREYLGTDLDIFKPFGTNPTAAAAESVWHVKESIFTNEVFYDSLGASNVQGLTGPSFKGSEFAFTLLMRPPNEGSIGCTEYTYITLEGTVSANGKELSGSFSAGHAEPEPITIVVNGELQETCTTEKWVIKHGESGSWSATRTGGGSPEAHVHGRVADYLSKGLEGVKVGLEGTSDESEHVSLSTTSKPDGTYSFEVPPGKYSVSATGEPHEQNGGTLAALSIGGGTGGNLGKCDGDATGATCALNALKSGESGEANFSYTACTSSEREPNGKPVTGCPIVFVPGFLGSRLACETGEVWTNIPNSDFKDMALQADGETNETFNSCAKTVAPLSGLNGLVRTAAGADVYDGAAKFLERIAPSHAFGYPYDWRKSPLLAVNGLNSLVEEALSDTGAKHVVIMAHSMGGLVTLAYLRDSGNAEKVARVITLGTPYWGAPKGHVALLSGKSDELTTEWFGLDIPNYLRSLTVASAENYLQISARNLLGQYWLYPSAEYGPWLTVLDPAFSNKPRGGSELDPWVARLHGNPQLVDQAVQGHAELNGFETHGVPYHVMIGVGVPTMTALSIETDVLSDFGFAAISYGSGDGTVPVRSASVGTYGTATPLPGGATLDTVCGPSHLQLPDNSGVQKRIEGFLLRGEAVKPSASPAEEDCPYTGQQLTLLGFRLPARAAAAASNSASVVTSSGHVLSIQSAQELGLIEARWLRDGTVTVVTDAHHPVTLRLNGRAIRVVSQSLHGHSGNFGGTGAPAFFGPVTGTLKLTESGARLNGHRIRSSKAGAPPHARAITHRHGSQFIVALTATARSGIASIYYRVGAGPSHLYRSPLRLTAAQLHSLRFVAYDRFGRASRITRG